jgi:hypothetical protein
VQVALRGDPDMGTFGRPHMAPTGVLANRAPEWLLCEVSS